MTELFIIRHGQTEWNVQHRYQGQCNSPLTEEGRTQALVKSKALAQLSPDVLFASDAERAMVTGRLLFPGREPIGNPLLREIALGDLEGVVIEEAKPLYPDSTFFFDRPAAFVPPGHGVPVPACMPLARPLP